MVAIKGAFANDDQEFNGLEAYATEFVDNPLERRIVVGVVETTRIVKDISAGGVEKPTIRFAQIEVLSGAEADQAMAMLQKRFRQRTGREADGQESLFGTAQTPVEPAWPGDVDYDNDAVVEPSESV